MPYVFSLCSLLVDHQPEKGGNTQSVTGSKNVQISGSDQIGKCLFSSRVRMLAQSSDQDRRMTYFLSNAGAISGAKAVHNVTLDTLHGTDCMGPDDHDESGIFFDIDDVEVCYFFFVGFHLVGGNSTGQGP